MNIDYKKINIGLLIKNRVKEIKLPISRICNYFNCTESKIFEYYNSSSIDSQILLRWCKLLEYDFFRIYTQHLIFYSPISKKEKQNTTDKSALPYFRKNIYTSEIKEYVLKLLNEKKMSCKQITDKYGIPKTTVHRWANK